MILFAAKVLLAVSILVLAGLTLAGLLMILGFRRW